MWSVYSTRLASGKVTTVTESSDSSGNTTVHVLHKRGQINFRIFISGGMKFHLQGHCVMFYGGKILTFLDIQYMIVFFSSRSTRCVCH